MWTSTEILVVNKNNQYKQEIDLLVEKLKLLGEFRLLNQEQVDYI